MGCLSCQVVSIHYAKFLQQNINAAARLHSEHSDDAVCPCTPSLYLSMDPNITHHTDLKIHLSARQCSSSITQKYGEGKHKENQPILYHFLCPLMRMSHESVDFALWATRRS